MKKLSMDDALKLLKQDKIVRIVEIIHLRDESITSIKNYEISGTGEYAVKRRYSIDKFEGEMRKRYDDILDFLGELYREIEYINRHIDRCNESKIQYHME